MPAPDSIPVPASLEDRYAVLRELGRGAFGCVLLARDRSLDRRVAIKLLTAMSPSKELLARFTREAKVTASLDHPHVVGLYDFALEPGGGYLIYEYIEGRDLARQLGAVGPPPTEVALAWGEQVGGALQAAHDQGVVHRDVKPHNVMIRRSGDAVLCDFGLARRVEGATVLTATDSVVGTPAYIPLEVLLGEPVTPAADQFAWAAVLYEMLYRRRLRESGDIMAVLSRVVKTRTHELEGHDLSRHPSWEGVFWQALDPDPRARYPDLRAFLADLRAHAPATAPLEGVATGSFEGSWEPDASTRPAAPAPPPPPAGRLLPVGAALLVALGLGLAAGGGPPTPPAPTAPPPGPAPATPDGAARFADAWGRLPAFLARADPGGDAKVRAMRRHRELLDVHLASKLRRVAGTLGLPGAPVDGEARLRGAVARLLDELLLLETASEQALYRAELREAAGGDLPDPQALRRARESLEDPALLEPGP